MGVTDVCRRGTWKIFSACSGGRGLVIGRQTWRTSDFEANKRNVNTSITLVVE